MRYSPETALLVVDVQNDFADAAGSLFVPGGDRAVPSVNDEVRAAAEGGALVVYTQDWHPTTTPHFQKDGGIWPVHCVAGSWGADFHPALDVVAGAPVVRKGVAGEDGYSAFSVREPTTGEKAATGLHALLQQRGVEAVVVVGLATDYCVKETVLDAARLGYRTAVVTAAVRAVDLEPGDGDRAIEAMRAAGATLD
jgi:nicotinamidase/pyrazinamidase